MKKVLALVLILVLALGAYALAEEKKYTIGMAQCNLGEPWRVAMNDQIAAEAAKYPMFEVIYIEAPISSAPHLKGSLAYRRRTIG